MLRLLPRQIRLANTHPTVPISRDQPFINSQVFARNSVYMIYNQERFNSIKYETNNNNKEEEEEAPGLLKFLNYLHTRVNNKLESY